MTDAATTAPPTPTRRLAGARLPLLVTAGGIALNSALEVVEAVLLPGMREDLAKNIVLVGLWSLIGLAITAGLVRLGSRPPLRTAMTWTLALLGLSTVLPMFWAAIPATLAAGAIVLAADRPGSARAARLLAIVAIAAFVAVSVGMFPFTEV